MEMQNITISLPKKTLRRIKLIATERETSISKMVSEALEKIVNEASGYGEARARQKTLMETGFELGFEKPASRDELHERR